MARATNRHHLWWPRRDYVTQLERKFRNLPCNVVEMEQHLHFLIHIHQDPPRKPSRADMIAAVERHERRACGCSPNH